VRFAVGVAGRAFATGPVFRATRRADRFGEAFWRLAADRADVRAGLAARLPRDRVRELAGDRLAFRARAEDVAPAFRFAAFFAIRFCAPQLTRRP